MTVPDESQVPHWCVPFLDEDTREWIWEHGILSLAKNDWQAKEYALAFYNAIGGMEQGRLATDPTHASYYDRPRYAELVSQTIALARQPVSLALDLGCGDGRGTRMLLDAGVPHIIAVDFHLPSLQRLVARLAPSERERVVPVWAPVTVEPFPDVRCDVAICIEVLTTLRDPRPGLAALQKWVNRDRGGVVLIIEPAVEGSLIYALIEGDLAAAKHILERHCRYDRIGDRALEVHLWTQSSLAAFLRDGGLDVLAQQHIPAGAALSLFSLKRKGERIEIPELELVRLADELKDFVPRAHAVIARVPPTAADKPGKER